MNNLDKKLIDFYNNNLYYFRRLREHDKKYYKNIFDALQKFGLEIKGKKVLDIGSGTGELLRILKEEFGDYSAVGVEISEIGLRMHRYGKPIKADARKLPFESGQFDIVFCIDVLEHIPNFQRVIIEAYRVVGPGGYILIRTPNYNCPLLSFSKEPDLIIKKKVVADQDVVSRTTTKGIVQEFKKLDGKILLYESWASFNWKIPVLKILNNFPLIKDYGGTCTVLFQKRDYSQKRK